MKNRFNNHSFVSEQEEYENSPENSADSPPSAPFSDTNITTSTSSSKVSRRAVQKRIVSIPIREVEGSRLKGETNSPPSDSWAWRKYGQKPIKGSPYPRGYYRCSSSKGCPARKQVERSRVDPSMLVVTYSSDHNHPWPPSRNNSNNNNNHTHPNNTSTATVTPPPEPENTPIFTKQVEPEEEKLSSIEEGFSEFKWFSDLESCSCAMLESPLLEGEFDNEVGMIFSMREEDESLFADLGELPECSLVFRRGIMEREEERRPPCTFGALV